MPASTTVGPKSAEEEETGEGSAVKGSTFWSATRFPGGAVVRELFPAIGGSIREIFHEGGVGRKGPYPPQVSNPENGTRREKRWGITRHRRNWNRNSRIFPHHTCLAKMV